jgi:hypothetical protein
MNLFLTPVDLLINARIEGNPNQQTKIVFKYFTKGKQKEFDIQNDLTRNLNAQIQLSIIYAIHFAFNQDIILNTHLLSETIATKKTFTKAFQNIEEIIKGTTSLNETKRLIIDTKNIVEMEGTFVVE